jgi:folate-binding protein YgfZ
MTFADLLEGRACLPLGPRALWKVTGPDRVRFLNGQTTQDIAALRPGHAAHAAVTNAKGKMDADVWITAHPDALWIDAPLELRASLGPRLERYLIADDAQIEDCTGAFDLFHALGAPEGSECIAAARFLRPGRDWWLPPGAPAPLPTAPPDAIEALRILQGVPRWGRDIGPQHLPPEAAFERDAISYRKGCYIGQEVIARIKSVGRVNKRLVQLVSKVTEPPPLPAAIFTETGPVGELTSACRHPLQPGCLGLAILPRALAESPSPVTIAGSPWHTAPLQWPG